MRVRTPHSGYHEDGRVGRFFEGWYFRVTLPDMDESFALIYSTERGGNVDPAGRVAAQVMGLGDGYIAQSATDAKAFWAERDSMALGACFQTNDARKFGDVPRNAVDEIQFNDMIKHGFQATDTWHQGSIVHAPGTSPGDIEGAVENCEWAFKVRPIYGWGNAGENQASTAGWLSSLPVFEPHWQVLMAHGVAEGYFQWGERRVQFNNCPIYAEKNWGAGFPKKWAWLQCNAFTDYAHLAVTCVAAKRSLPGGAEEEVGLIGIHHQGSFYELAPWRGPVKWSVEPWGSWHHWAKNSEVEALLEATCDADAGTVLRAPTPDEGLSPACKDTFAGDARLRMWKLDATGVRVGEPFVDAHSSACACEVGGGPWWGTWKKDAQMNEAVKLALGMPIASTLDKVESMLPFKIPSALKPPGI